MAMSQQESTLDGGTGCVESTEHDFLVSIYSAQLGDLFLDDRLAESIVQSLAWARKQFKWQLFCYCLMPDNLHFVCRMMDVPAPVGRAARQRKTEGVLDHLAKFKNFTTNASWKLGFQGRLWGDSDCTQLKKMDKSFEDVIQHVLDNPVRSGLVNQWSDWPHSKIVDTWQ